MSAPGCVSEAWYPQPPAELQVLRSRMLEPEPLPEPEPEPEAGL